MIKFPVFYIDVDQINSCCKNIRSILATGLLVFCSIVIFGQEDKSEKKKRGRDKAQVDVSESIPYFDSGFVDNITRVYDAKIKTLLIHTNSSELDPPIITLGGGEKIILQFDDLSSDMRDMHYSFEHCSHNWTSSDLQKMDFQQGFNEDIINTYDFSFNTIVPFVHYRLEIPNQRIDLTRSGNYLIKVFANSDPTQVMLTARFMIAESNVAVSTTIRPSSIISERDYRQEVDITLNLRGVSTMNPFNDISLVVLQNFRWDNAKHDVQPSFVKDSQLIYNHQGLLTFDGVNEFRKFDAKSIRYRSEEVKDVLFEKDGYKILLAPDVRKPFSRYTFVDDLNGRFLIKNDDMSDAHLESDYVQVYFNVPVDAMLGNGDLYIFGQLSNWQLQKELRMEFNYDNLSYEHSVMLKQGYYNYMYLWQYKSQQFGITDFTEGNHAETENEYLILVYFQDQSTFADRLIGYKLIGNYDQ